MGRTRTRQGGHFTARLPDGRKLRIDVLVTEEEVSTLADTQDAWAEVSRRYESALGPVNETGGQLALARDGTKLERL